MKFTYISETNSVVERLAERLKHACVLIHVSNNLFKVLHFWQLYCTKSKCHVLCDWINSSAIWRLTCLLSNVEPWIERIPEFYCNIIAFHLRGYVPPGDEKVIHKLRIRKHFWSNVFNENPAVDSMEMKFWVIKIQNVFPVSNFHSVKWGGRRKGKKKSWRKCWKLAFTNTWIVCQVTGKLKPEVCMLLGISPLENLALHEALNADIWTKCLSGHF